MAMSKDRVEFTLKAYYFTGNTFHSIVRRDFSRLLGDAFGITLETYAKLSTLAACHGEVRIICRPSQFARFLIMREQAGFQNQFKELNAQLIDAPKPVASPIDVSGVPAKKSLWGIPPNHPNCRCVVELDESVEREYVRPRGFSGFFGGGQ